MVATKDYANAAFFALFVVFGNFLFSRRVILWTLYANSPSKLRDYNILENAGVEFDDVVSHCEDAYMNDVDGWAILSCDPGRADWNTVMGHFRDSSTHPDTGLYLYHYIDQETAVPKRLTLSKFDTEVEGFHPLGIEYVPQSKTLYVVNHATSGSRIETFRLKVDNSEAVHINTIQHPDLPTPNSIAALSPNSLVVTNDHHYEIRKSKWLAMAETNLAFSISTVVRLDLDISRAARPPKVTVLAKQAFPNGVVVLDPNTIAVASSTRAMVYIYTSPSKFTKGKQDVKKIESLELPFIPDNLSVDSDGKLLIAGHPYAPSLSAVAKKGRNCEHPPIVEKDEFGNEWRTDPDDCPRAPSWILEWSKPKQEDGDSNSPAFMQGVHGMKSLFVSYDYGTVTTAVRDAKRGIGLAVGLYDKGIMTWSSPPVSAEAAAN